jgi:hypothetical protein
MLHRLVRAGALAEQCSATTRAADLVLSAADLGAAYLGGTPLSVRAAAGHVEDRTPGLLPWPRPPSGR